MKVSPCDTCCMLSYMILVCLQIGKLKELSTSLVLHYVCYRYNGIKRKWGMLFSCSCGEYDICQLFVIFYRKHVRLDNAYRSRTADKSIFRICFHIEEGWDTICLHATQKILLWRYKRIYLLVQWSWHYWIINKHMCEGYLYVCVWEGRVKYMYLSY